MKRTFLPNMKVSKNPSKQRKYIANAALHIKQKFTAAPLSKQLREKYKTRSMKVRKGDKVKILRGQFKNKTGKIESVDLKKSRVKVDTIFTNRRDGSKSSYPLHASNLQITELNTEDKRRMKKLKQEVIKKWHTKKDLQHQNIGL